MSRVETVALKSARWIATLAAVAAVSAVAAVAVAAQVKPTAVSTHQTKRGKVLSTTSGYSLYMFSSDKAGKSNCTGTCAKTWIPLLTSARPVAAANSGVNGKLLGTVKRSAHVLQVTYNGHPLYRFNRDKSAGQITGEGANQFSGHWYLVNTAGSAVKPKSSSGPVCNPLCQSY